MKISYSSAKMMKNHPNNTCSNRCRLPGICMQNMVRGPVIGVQGTVNLSKPSEMEVVKMVQEMFFQGP